MSWDEFLIVSRYISETFFVKKKTSKNLGNVTLK